MVQIATEFSHAPVAYVLSAFAAAFYIVATVTLAVGNPAARRIAVLSCSVELIGVLAVGTWSLAKGDLPGRDGVVRLRQRLRLRPSRPSGVRPALAQPLEQGPMEQATHLK